MFFRKKEKKEKTPKEILDSFVKLEKKVTELEAVIEEMKKENKKNVQKVGLIRFNPFSNTGGDQSFSLALLDGEKNGIVITSFYSREGSSVYGKSIENGKSKYVLSKEEEKAIEKALSENLSIDNEEIKNKKTVKKKRKKEQ